MPQSDDILPLPEIYYQASGSRSGGAYFAEDTRGRWIRLNETSIKRLLIQRGYSPDHLRTESLSALGVVLTRIQLEQNVDYAAPLAGYRAGRYESNGRPILVTESSNVIEPVEGDWPILHGILEMFNDAICDQRPYVFGWLKQATLGARVGNGQ